MYKADTLLEIYHDYVNLDTCTCIFNVMCKYVLAQNKIAGESSMVSGELSMVLAGIGKE